MLPWSPVSTLSLFDIGACFVSFFDKYLKGEDNHEEVISLEGQGTMFLPPAFSPDGTVIGCMNANGVLHLWRAPSWLEIEAAERAGK